MFTRVIKSCSALAMLAAGVLLAAPAAAEVYLQCDGAVGTKTL